jgi:hypothetical protein
MPVLLPSQALLIGFIVAPSLFGLSVFFTHASRRHILGALVGAGLYALVNYAWDQAAAAFGWWSYPAWSDTGQFPPAAYLVAGLVGGGAFGLVGWRIIRRWRWKGFAVFLLFWAVYAIVHDYGGSLLFASSRLMLFGAGPVPLIAIVSWYVTGNAVPPVVIWLIGDWRSGVRND